MAGWRGMVARSAMLTLLAVASLVMFFEAWRVILLLSLGDRAVGVPGSVLGTSFAVGLRFDAAVAAYVGIPLYLLCVAALLMAPAGRVARRLFLWVISAAAGVTFFIHLADIEFFKFFNTRLNGMALQWSDTPGFMVSMIWQTYPVVWYLLLYIGMLAGFVWLVRKGAGVILDSPVRPSRLTEAVWIPLVLMLLLLGGRGRIEEKAPLTWGLAYFSSYDLANQLALNPTFTFLRDAVYDRGNQEETRKVMEGGAEPDAPRLVRELLGVGGETGSGEAPQLSRIDTGKGDGTPPNVIVIIMESFGSSHIGCLDNLVPYGLTPFFDSIAQQGTLFTNIYSAGSHTYAGILGTLYGYPTIYGKSIMKQMAGQNRFLGLPNLLRDRGYRTFFYTTHDPHFDNMQGFLMANGVERVVSLFDYDEADKLSTLGVADHIMFDRALEELRAAGEGPWFAALLTATNHGPWVVPEVPFGSLPDSAAEQQRLNAFKYSDWALGRFLNGLATAPAFANTLVVVTADNGMLYRPQVDLDPTQFRIPILLLGPANKDAAGVRVDRLGSQIDIVATVMGRLPFVWENRTFGRDLLSHDDGDPAWAEFSDWDRVGFVQNGWYGISRIDGPSSLYRVDTTGARLILEEGGGDVLPSEVERFRKLGMAVFAEAYFNLFRQPAGLKR